MSKQLLRDLNDLYAIVLDGLKAIEETFKRNNVNLGAQAFRVDLLKQINVVKKNTTNFFEFSKHLTSYAEKSQKDAESLRAQNQSIKKALEKAKEQIQKLEEESMIVRVEYNKKEKQMKQLKIINKFDIAYIDSMEIRKTLDLSPACKVNNKQGRGAKIVEEKLKELMDVPQLHRNKTIKNLSVS